MPRSLSRCCSVHVLWVALGTGPQSPVVLDCGGRCRKGSSPRPGQQSASMSPALHGVAASGSATRRAAPPTAAPAPSTCMGRSATLLPHQRTRSASRTWPRHPQPEPSSSLQTYFFRLIITSRLISAGEAAFWAWNCACVPQLCKLPGEQVSVTNGAIYNISFEAKM